MHIHSVVRSVALAAVLIAVLPALGVSAPLYGVTLWDQGSAPPVSSPGVDVQNLQQLSYSDSFSLTSTGGTSVLSGSIDNGALHAYAQASSSNGSEVYANLAEYFYDTFTAVGPAGQTGQFLINMTFTASETETNEYYGSELYNELTLVENGTIVPAQQTYQGGIQAINVNAVSPPTQTNSAIVYIQSGSSVTLGDLLQITDQVVGYGGGYTSTATMNDSDTGFFTVTPVTPGFSFTTASGLTYSGDPDAVTATPEPATMLLMGAGLIGVGVAGRRKLRKRI
jgi:hypothetical protein